MLFGVFALLGAGLGRARPPPADAAALRRLLRRHRRHRHRHGQRRAALATSAPPAWPSSAPSIAMAHLAVGRRLGRHLAALGRRPRPATSSWSGWSLSFVIGVVLLRPAGRRSTRPRLAREPLADHRLRRAVRRVRRWARSPTWCPPTTRPIEPGVPPATPRPPSTASADAGQRPAGRAPRRLPRHRPRVRVRARGRGPARPPRRRRSITDLACERVDYSAGRGICLTADRGAVTTYGATIFDQDLADRRHPRPARPAQPHPGVGRRPPRRP